MIDFKKAIEIAQKYYQEKGQLELTKIYESKNIWVVYAGKKSSRFGNAGIAIDKETGEISSFILPSRTILKSLKMQK
ncbi:MAG: hypothetical protein ACLRV8_04260 [Blautia hansenii]